MNFFPGGLISTMAVFVNYDIFIVILDQAMSHLMSHFLLSRRI